MKMKEVTEKTGLTDRAVRLYIDEGLALPNIEESYSGRKSINFSESDVERLKNVALLRKAGFSIADIKSMVDDNSTAKHIIDKFIEQTESNIAHETEIVEKLKGISFDENVTIEKICESLSATVEEKEVPKEDLKSIFWKKAEDNPYKFAGIIGLIFTGVVYVLTFLLCTCEYKHLAIADDWFSWVLLCFSGWLVLDVLCVLLLLLNRKKSDKRNKKHRKFISGTISVFSLITGVIAFYISIFSYLLHPFYSYTTNIKDYMVLDSWVEEKYGDEIHTLFPDEIPENALVSSDKYFNSAPFTTRYFYKYSCDLDTFINIFAEWKLNPDEYEEAKSNAIKSAKHTEQKGDWVLIHYNDIYSDKYYFDSDYYIFAYNDKSNKVRYIAAITDGSHSGEPYYLSLDW